MKLKKATSIYKRPLSMADLGYIGFGYRSTHLDQDISQCVIEGEGVIDDAKLSSAVEKVAEAIPACRSVLRGWGRGRGRYWSAEGPLPEVRSLHCDWDGHYREDLDFLEKSLDIVTGPVVEIVQIVSGKTFLLFRFHHAVMDGMAMSEFVVAFFQALRLEPIEKFHSAYTLENLVATKIRTKPFPSISRAVTALGDRPVNKVERPRQREWRRVKVSLNDRMALPEVAVALAKLTRENEDGAVRFSLPVNLRRHCPEEKTSANLVGIISVDMDADDTARTFVRKVNALLREEMELPSEKELKGTHVLKALPLPLLRVIGKMLLRVVFRSQIFRASGTISSMGKNTLTQFCADNFAAHTFFGIPISPTGSPLFVVICSTESATEITLSATRQLAGEEGLHQLADKLAALIEGRKRN